MKSFLESSKLRNLGKLFGIIICVLGIIEIFLLISDCIYLGAYCYLIGVYSANQYMLNAIIFITIGVTIFTIASLVGIRKNTRVLTIVFVEIILAISVYAILSFLVPSYDVAPPCACTTVRYCDECTSFNNCPNWSDMSNESVKWSCMTINSSECTKWGFLEPTLEDCRRINNLQYRIGFEERFLYPSIYQWIARTMKS